MSSDAVPQNPAHEIPKLYEPQAAQARWFPYWEQHGYFNAEPGQVGTDGKPKKPHTESMKALAAAWKQADWSAQFESVQKQIGKMSPAQRKQLFAWLNENYADQLSTALNT